MTKFEFGSDSWARAVCRIVEDLADGEVLPDGPYSFSETYTHPPEHLKGHALGWHLEIADGALRTGIGPLSNASFAVITHYDVVAPFVALAYRDHPNVIQEAREAVLPALQDGRFRSIGTTRPSDIIPAFAQLHDLVADITLPWSAADPR